MDKREKIVVIGGGFAGLSFIKHIDKKKYEVILVDRNNFHAFPPLFYQVASSGLDPASISFPFRREMTKRRARGASFHMGEVRSIDLTGRTVETNLERLPFDRLVICAGTTNNFFGNDKLRDRVFTLKSTAEAIRVRNELLDRLERAAVCNDPVQRRHMLSFVVIGGGPTGVEVAGAIGEMKRYVLHREYPGINPDEVNITLLEGTDRVLGAMSATASRDALRDLQSLMVDVRLNTLMTDYSRDELILSDGSRLHSEMVIWTAGITGEPFTLEGETAPRRGPGGRFITDGHCRLVGADRIYAVGDISYTPSPAYPRGYPQLAQVAIQQAEYLARALNQETPPAKPFTYRDKGSMATIGRGRAVADLKRLHLSGCGAWLVWMFIHLISILGMRNKLITMINWIWAYFSYNTALRLLIHTSRYPLRRRWGE